MKCPKCQLDNPRTSRFCADCGTRLELHDEIGIFQTLTIPSSLKKELIGKEFGGKYKILGELGKGGMGEVYLAEDTTLSRRVALKFLPEELYEDQTARSRFFYEAKAAAALDHPYICSIHEVGETEGRLFFAMEYLEGQTLRDRILKEPIPLKQALQIAVETAEALEVAHEKGIIHRDIKPANIMLMQNGHAKVMDFGLAKQLRRAERIDVQADPLLTLTGEGSAPGTPAYMSPEQLQGKNLDERSDIFSFGVVLYEILTRQHPFKRETGLTTVSAILSEPPKPITQFVKGIPEPVQRAIDRMLAKDIDERYASIQDVLRDLKKILLDLPTAPRAVRFLRSIRVALAVSVFVFLAIASVWLAKTLFFKSAAKALAFQERDWILITDFDNQTGEQVFDGSLETALTVGIQQSQYVNVFPRNRVQETLKRMRREDVKKVDESVGSEVATREGLKALLACSIGKIGDEYLLTARIIDSNTQAAVFSQPLRAKGKDRVLGALDELAGKVRRELGESLAKISGQKLALAKATTSSLEALKFYTEAKFAPGSAAVQLLLQAISLDPDFALAQAELGSKYSISGNRQKAEEHFQKALSLLDRLTIREQLWIRAIVEDWRGNRDQGIENYKAYLSQYPDDSGAWFRLGYAYLITKRFELGIEAFKKVIEIDPESATAYINLASCYAAARKDAEALPNYEKAFELRPEEVTSIFVNGEYSFLLVRMGRIGDAALTLERMLQQDDPSKKAMGYRSLALLNIYLGKYSAAQGHLEEAVRITKTSHLKLSELRNHLFLAAVFLTKSGKDGFEKEMTAIRQIQKELRIEPYFIYLVGKAYARVGRLKEAIQQLEDMKSRLGDVLAESSVARSNRGDQASFYMLQGEVKLAQKQYAEAINSFQTAASLGASLFEESLAYAHLRSGNLDKAIEKYREFLQNHHLMANESLESWVLAHYELGKILEQKGQTEESAKYYDRLLDIWKEADQDLAVVVDTKNRLANLKKI